MGAKRLFDEIPRIEGKRIILKRIEDRDAEALAELSHSTATYQYLPTYLLEQQYDDPHEVIAQMYGAYFDRKESLILGIYLKDGMQFCGIAEMYELVDRLHAVSIGYRLLERFWGMGIASETVDLMVDYLYSETDIEIITASTMLANEASANVLRKNDFIQTSAGDEDWGYDEPTVADRWFR